MSLLIGRSAGAIESAWEIVRGLPRDFPAAIFIGAHFPVSVTNACRIEPGRPRRATDRHLFIENTSVRLSRDPEH